MVTIYKNAVVIEIKCRFQNCIKLIFMVLVIEQTKTFMIGDVLLQFEILSQIY